VVLVLFPQHAITSIFKTYCKRTVSPVSLWDSTENKGALEAGFFQGGVKSTMDLWIILRKEQSARRSYLVQMGSDDKYDP
jgi:hypothetical protein